MTYLLIFLTQVKVMARLSDISDESLRSQIHFIMLITSIIAIIGLIYSTIALI